MCVVADALLKNVAEDVFNKFGIRIETELRPVSENHAQGYVYMPALHHHFAIYVDISEFKSVNNAAYVQKLYHQLMNEITSVIYRTSRSLANRDPFAYHGFIKAEASKPKFNKKQKLLCLIN